MKDEQSALILIVDDEPLNITIAGKVLEKKGYRIISASNGFEALALAEVELPDLILLDIMMPEMDGFEVCEKLAEIDAAKDIPVIFLTAVSDRESLIRAFRKGGRDYVRKPFYADELLARVQTHVNLKKAYEKQSKLINDLSKALEEIKQLSGLLPICSHCKKIRDDKGYWQVVERYISEHSEAQFSHSICPDCMRKHYPKIADKILNKTDKGDS